MGGRAMDKILIRRVLQLTWVACVRPGVKRQLVGSISLSDERLGDGEQDERFKVGGRAMGGAAYSLLTCLLG